MIVFVLTLFNEGAYFDISKSSIILKPSKVVGIYLKKMRKSQYFSLLNVKQGNYWYHFYNVFV